MFVSSDQMFGLDAKVALKRALVEFHQFPYWFSSRLGGMPTIDALFGDIFYPPSLLVTMVSSIPRSIGFKMILHIFLAGLFFFLLLREGFRMHPLVCITGAIFYMFNPQFVSHIYPGHDGKMYVIAWLPFILWQLKDLLTAPRLLTMTLVGLGIGICMLTSHIQMTYFILWGAFFYWLTASGIAIYKKNTKKKIVTASLYFWCAVILGLGLGAMQLFPSFLYIRDSFSVRGADRGFEFASSWSLHWPEFFSLWVPEFVNTLDYYWGQNPFKLNSEYAGMMPVLLSAGAIALKPRRPWRIFWGVTAIGAVLFALGANTPVFHIAYAIIPGVRKFRAASMIMFWFSFSTILLATLFLKDLLSGTFQSISELQRSKWRKGLLIAAGVCLALTVLFSLQGFIKGLFASAMLDQQKDRLFALNFKSQFRPFLWMWCIFTLCVLFLLRASISKGVSPKIVIAVILILGAIDILRVDYFAAWNPKTERGGFLQLTSPRPYFYRDPALTPLCNEMKRAPFRCFTLPGALPKNGVGIHGLEGVGGFHDNELHWYREFRGDQQDRNYLSSLIGVTADGQPYLRAEKLSEGNPFLNIANARYLLVRKGSQLLAIQNKNAFERLSFVPGYIIVDSASTVAKLGKTAYDYHKQVALTAEPELPPGFTLADKTPTNDFSFTTKWQTYSPNYRKAIVTAASDGFMRISEVYYPGWEIRIDGKRTPYYRADLAWITTPVTAGSHTVELSPHSHYLKRFVIISFVALLLVVVVWIRCAIAKYMYRGKKKTAPS
ncbi:MAG: hypothetical protein JXA18_08255 [Chitinispirillaceae bacterium]|nr:hypothetical protein [Chitinispirillaceae bacterium]